VKEKSQHFVLAAVLICMFAVLVILGKWYRAGDLDPKFKYLIIFVVATVVLTAIAVNVYVWEPQPVIPPPPKCDGLYQISTGLCFPMCNTEGYCLVTTGIGNCVSTNCTSSVFF